VRHSLIYAFCAATIFALAGALPGAADEGWRTERTDPSEYGTAADEIAPEAAQNLLLGLVNAERAKAGAAPLVLDDTATELALTRANEIAHARLASHYDSDGRKVEQRFNMLGRTDHAAENLLLYEIDYEVRLTPQLVQRMNLHWMKEPGHRANILDPAHTAMGAGFAILPPGNDSATVIAGATIFVNDYGDCDRLPPSVAPGSHVWLTGHLTPGITLAAITLAHESYDETARPEAPQHYRMPAPAIAYIPEDADFPTSKGRPYLIHAVDYNPQTGYFSVELYFPRHWNDCRIYVNVLAATATLETFSAMTQVLETRDHPAGPEAHEI
jgi:uncharacterized protein YkwD